MKKRRNIYSIRPLTNRQIDTMERAQDQANEFVLNIMKAIKKLPPLVKPITVDLLKQTFDTIDLTIQWDTKPKKRRNK